MEPAVGNLSALLPEKNQAGDPSRRKIARIGELGVVRKIVETFRKRLNKLKILKFF